MVSRALDKSITSTFLMTAMLAICNATAIAAADQLDYEIEVQRNFVPKPGHYWSQARAAAIPPGAPGVSGDHPQVLLTMQPIATSGTHNYFGILSARTDDLGRRWFGPTEQPALAPRRPNKSVRQVPVDSTPGWHDKSKKLLLTGATFYVDEKSNRDIAGAKSEVFYAVYDPATRKWDRWKTLDMPNDFEWPYKRSGCAQRVDLPNGDVLLPIYFGDHNNSIHLSTVVRCRFDGKTLSYVEHGSELVINFGRGYSEPSLAQFGDRFFLTLRNDRAGYVTASDDGLHFGEPRLWRFDDGKQLGSYNTQQHWMTHGDALFLTYTRRGADNDDVMRNRAPIFMAQVNPDTLRVIRGTERIVVPKFGKSAMGNFGVANITQNESWIVVGARVSKSGEPNVFISRVKWSKPNRLVSY